MDDEDHLGLHFRFVEDHGFAIEELGAHRRECHVETTSNGKLVDYGLVTRLVNSTTGQFVVCTAGIMADGSEAAAQLASSNSDLMAALQNASPDWEHKNIQIVVNTAVTDHVAGPAHVVVVYAW